MLPPSIGVDCCHCTTKIPPYKVYSTSTPTATPPVGWESKYPPSVPRTRLPSCKSWNPARQTPQTFNSSPLHSSTSSSPISTTPAARYSITASHLLSPGAQSQSYHPPPTELLSPKQLPHHRRHSTATKNPHRGIPTVPFERACADLPSRIYTSLRPPKLRCAHSPRRPPDLIGVDKIQ